MWGEIDPCIKPIRNVPYEPLSDESEDEDKMDQYVCEPSNPTELIQDTASNPLDSMISAIVVSGSPVKSQQLGEPDLSVEEKTQLLMEQYNTKPVVFLERYHTHLKPEHLDAFSHVSSDCRTQYYCTEVQKRALGSAKKTRVRNHRYAALCALQKEGQYFSEEQMRFRAPLLYEQYIGQYLSEEELMERSQETMQMGSLSLSGLLINSYQEKQLQKRLEREQARENCAEQEDEEEEQDDNEESTKVEWEPTAEEKAMLREEFLSQMHQSFLEGKDKGFNYSEVDENPEYDNLDILSHDAEEKYFDEEEVVEEEDEEEEEEEVGQEEDTEEEVMEEKDQDEEEEEVGQEEDTEEEVMEEKDQEEEEEEEHKGMEEYKEVEENPGDDNVVKML